MLVQQRNGALQTPPPVAGAPLTIDSPSLGARRRLEHDATNTTRHGRYPARDDAVTSLTATISTTPYGRCSLCHGNT